MAELITMQFLKDLLYKQVVVRHPDPNNAAKMKVTKGFLIEVNPFAIKVKVGSSSTAKGDGASALVQVQFKLEEIDKIDELFD